jgi:1-aminocyclopropane-1-carboxylate deaminase/D-cysteine desulfhydrase-like pyridoxal-dependent ACC family enzyme
MSQNSHLSHAKRSQLKELTRLGWVHSTPLIKREITHIKSHPPLEVLLKRDGLMYTNPQGVYGANKIRKLDYVLPHLLKGKINALSTVGSEGSHHVLATITAARQLGIDIYVALTPQPHSEHSIGVYEQIKQLATGVHHLSVNEPHHFQRELSKWRLHLDAERVAFIPTGGSSVYGVFGMVEGVYELVNQLDEGCFNRPTELYIATASGSSLAGLLLGLSLAWPAHQTPPLVIAVRVASKALVNRQKVRRLYQEAAQILQYSEPPPQLSILGDFLGEGYAIPTQRSQKALNWGHSQGVYFDPTYTAKAFGALLHREMRLAHTRARPKHSQTSSKVSASVDRAQKTVLFWHTLDERPPRSLNFI